MVHNTDIASTAGGMVSWGLEAQKYQNTQNYIIMTELETKIWNTVHNWCDEQSSEIPDQNRRYLMDEIKALFLSHVSKSVKIALLQQLEELSDHLPCQVYTKKVIEIKSNFNDR